MALVSRKIASGSRRKRAAKVAKTAQRKAETKANSEDTKRLGPFVFDRKISLPSILTLITSAIALYAIISGEVFGPRVKVSGFAEVALLQQNCYETSFGKYITLVPRIEVLNASSGSETAHVLIDSATIAFGKDATKEYPYEFHNFLMSRIKSSACDPSNIDSQNDSPYFSMKTGERFARYLILGPRFAGADTKANAVPVDIDLASAGALHLSMNLEIVNDGFIDSLFGWNQFEVTCNINLSGEQIAQFQSAGWADLSPDCSV